MSNVTLKLPAARHLKAVLLIVASLALACLAVPQTARAAEYDYEYYTYVHPADDLYFDAACDYEGADGVWCWSNNRRYYMGEQLRVNEKDKVVFVQYGDKAYTPEYLESHPDFTEIADYDQRIVFYPDGELRVQHGQYCLVSSIRRGCLPTIGLTDGIDHLPYEGDNDYTNAILRECTKKVTFDPSGFDGTVERLDLWYSHGLLDGAFEDFTHLTSVQGLDIERGVQMPYHCTRLFAGCTSLRELDISGAEWNHMARSITTEMLEDCVSLERLVFNETWTGNGVTFPVDMRCTQGAHMGEGFSAGDRIPVGAGTYVCNRTQLADGGTLKLFAPGSGEGAPELTGPLEYTGSAIEPRAVVEVGGETLTQGTDYTVRYKDNVEVGTAKVVVRGTGDYMGELSTTFEIQDTAAFALLYEDGTLVLQATHKPITGIIGNNYSLPTAYRWFYASDADAGRTVPWSAARGKITRVIVHPSFSRFAPASAAGWFSGCTKLESVEGLENLSTESMMSMAGMFAGCAALEELDLPRLTAADARGFDGFFDGCSALSKLVLSGDWQQAKAPPLPHDMFCESEGWRRYSAGDRPAGGKVLSRGISMQKADVVLEKTVLDYTGGPVTPGLQVSLGDTVLVEGIDYEVSCRDNIWPGTATVTVTGKGAFRDSVTKMFTLVDGSAYTFLYDDGTLVLQAGSGPVLGSASPSGKMPDFMRWLASDGTPLRSELPWERSRGKVRRVVIDPSFAVFAVPGCEGWFSGCEKLESVEGLENLNVAGGGSASRMFAGCTSLESLDLSELPAGRRIDFTGIVDGCTGLTELTGGSWDSGLAPRFPAEMFCESQGWKRYAKGDAVPSGIGTCRCNITLRWAKVVVDKTSFDCTERPITLDLDVMLGDTKLLEGTDYVVTYKDNVWPGTATATVEARGAFTGGLIVPFEIVDCYVHVGDRLVYRGGDATFTLRVTRATNGAGRTIAANATLERIEVTNRFLKTLTIPGQCTIGSVSVSITQVGGKLAGKFGNVSCVVIGPNVVAIGARAFAKAKKVSKLKVKSARLAKVTNCLKGSRVKRVETRVKLAKKRQRAYKKWFTKKAGKKGIRYSYKG